MKCNQCSGFGVILGASVESLKPVSIPCDLCRGTGRIRHRQILWRFQGALLRKKRESLGLTFRDAARKWHYDCSNISKMERGVIKPVNYMKAMFND